MSIRGRGRLRFHHLWRLGWRWCRNGDAAAFGTDATPDDGAPIGADAAAGGSDAAADAPDAAPWKCKDWMRPTGDCSCGANAGGPYIDVCRAPEGGSCCRTDTACDCSYGYACNSSTSQSKPGSTNDCSCSGDPFWPTQDTCQGDHCCLWHEPGLSPRCQCGPQPCAPGRVEVQQCDSARRCGPDEVKTTTCP
jgi:hypothetical protein